MMVMSGFVVLTERGALRAIPNIWPEACVSCVEGLAVLALRFDRIDRVNIGCKRTHTH